ncbi:putative quinol monooxygenase [Loktanella sp. M215]|uniref:putative quinol monooxygenase n=1 Tax=Loktanella sp. M215 TaxID=2675431 RepID=UPI001F3F4F52|nr:antibiotic biosynthesis monooxygenase [Loktanella sp. M215]MCF7700909.1 antibiotic biosynthesis monooxygenase [Loktanella sp. M215]
MHSLTAIIRARKADVATVRAALLNVGAYARDHEQGTVAFHVAQDPEDPCLFTTYERFTDKAAMQRHNDGPGSQGFFAAAGALLDGQVTVVMAEEIWPDAGA